MLHRYSALYSSIACKMCATTSLFDMFVQKFTSEEHFLHELFGSHSCLTLSALIWSTNSPTHRCISPPFVFPGRISHRCSPTGSKKSPAGSGSISDSSVQRSQNQETLIPLSLLRCRYFNQNQLAGGFWNVSRGELLKRCSCNFLFVRSWGIIV